MKKLYQILRIAILCVVGVFAGTSIQIDAIFTAAVVLLLLLAMQIVKRKMK